MLTEEDDGIHVIEIWRPRLPLATLAADVVDLPVHQRRRRPALQRERMLDHARRLQSCLQHIRIRREVLDGADTLDIVQEAAR
jgi:hypothetical protein